MSSEQQPESAPTHQAGQLRAWLRDRRRTLIFGFLGVCSSIVAVCLIYFARHPVNVDHSRTTFVALAFIILGGTFLIWAVATAPTQSRTSPTPAQGSSTPLPRVIAWGILVPIVAECSLVWFALHDDVDHAVICGFVAIALNFVGQMGAVALRAQLSSSSPHPS